MNGVHTWFWPEWNEHIPDTLGAIARSLASDPTAQLASGQGRLWNGPKTLHLDAALAPLLRAASRALEACTGLQLTPAHIHAWANVMQSGSWIERHNHVGNLFTAVHYPLPHDEDARLIVESDDGPELVFVRPQASVLYLFHGQAFHRVEVHRGALPRVSVALNFTSKARRPGT